MNASTFRMKLIRNIQSRVAKQLAVSRCHVSLVANSRRQSQRVEDALAKEYALVEREVLRFERNAKRKSA